MENASKRIKNAVSSVASYVSSYTGQNTRNPYNFLLKRRLKYGLVLAVFLISMFVFYYKDPYSIASKYFGYTTFVTILVGVFLWAMMVWYTYAFTNAQELHITENTTVPVYEYFVKALIFLVCIASSGALIYWVVTSINNLSNRSSIISLILNLLIIVVMFGLIYKIFLSNNYVQSSPIMRFLTNILFYIPCLFMNIVDYIVAMYQSEKNKTNRTEIIMLFLAILLIILYLIYLFVVPMIENRFITQGGKVVVNEPISIANRSVLDTYGSLNNIDPKAISLAGKYDYNYGISMWIYIDSFSTSMGVDKDTYIPVFDYGGKPTILYNGFTNTIMITVAPTDASDKPEPRIIYKEEKVLLQKWNSIIVNYNGGTLDIFYNGTLVKSESNVIHYMSLDTMSIGASPGIKGGICNLTYFKNVLDANQIYYLYNSVKNKTPPTLAKTKI